MMFSATRPVRLAALGLGLACLLGSAVSSQAGNRQSRGEAGQFDYYTLVLSWSPSYCEAQGASAPKSQCGAKRDFAFVVHGLWPQYHKGWPQFCRTTFNMRVPKKKAQAMLDIMPSMGLVFHEWKKHGTCSGLGPEGYLDLTRQAYARIKIPAVFKKLHKYITLQPKLVELAFQKDNPGLDDDMISVTCDKRRLREVRICMDKKLNFTACPALEKRTCRAKKVVMPPVR